MSKRVYYFVWIVLITLSPLVSQAQRTLVYTENDVLFKNALELFNKQKYSAAQKQFNQYLSQKNSNSLLASDAEYYAALCASELFNNDAEDLLINFIRNHPESPKLKMACFNLGNFLYRKKKFKESIEWLEKSDTYALTDEQLAEYYFKLGYAYFDNANYTNAKKNFIEIKDKETRFSGTANYYYSHISYTEKNYETALRGFLKLTKDPLFAHIIPYYVAQIYYLQAKYDSVISYAPSLLDSANTKRAPEIAHILGESYYRTNKFKEAIPYLEMYEEKGGISTRDDYYQLGFVYYKTGNYTKALDFFKKTSVEKDSMSQVVLYNMADCYLKLNKKDFARNTFESCSKLKFNEELREDAFFNYAKLNYEMDYNPYDHAILAFDAFLNEFPNTTKKDEAYRYLLNVYLSTQNYKAALESIDKIEKLTEDLKYAHQRIAYNRGVELYNNQEYNDAYAMLTRSLKYIKDKPMAASAIYWKAEINYRNKKYTNAISDYKEFIFEPGAALTPYFNLANYNIGYACYSMQEYTEAISWFRKFAGDKNEKDEAKLNDANLRIADCYFINKSYANAAEYYNKASQINTLKGDYALLQYSIASGLTNMDENKKTALSKLISNYPKSVYLADAYFELGNTLLDRGENDEAITCFKKLNADFPNSSYTKKALLKEGMVYFNSDKNEQAIDLFKRIIKDYPATEEAKDALNQIKYILLKANKIDEWEEVAKNTPFANLSVTELDSVAYDNANKNFSNGNWELASKDFETYLKKFPEGIFCLQATYYKAESDYKLTRFEQSLSGYENISNRPKNKYTEDALVKAIYLANKTGKNENLIGFYEKLEQLGEKQSNVHDARIGLMRNYHKTGNSVKAKEYANKVLLSEKVLPELGLEARLISAQSSQTLKDTTSALAEFIALSNNNPTETGANARFQAAQIYYDQKKIPESEKLVYEIINQDPSYDLWVAKSFILLSDLLVSKGDNFQAKATLQSIIENYDGPELVKVAQQKLDKIIQSEKVIEQQKLKEQMEINIAPANENNDQKLFEEENPKEGGNNNEN